MVWKWKEPCSSKAACSQDNSVNHTPTKSGGSTVAEFKVICPEERQKKMRAHLKELNEKRSIIEEEGKFYHNMIAEIKEYLGTLDVQPEEMEFCDSVLLCIDSMESTPIEPLKPPIIGGTGDA